jgi:hypothetical protein
MRRWLWALGGLVAVLVIVLVVVLITRDDDSDSASTTTTTTTTTTVAPSTTAAPTTTATPTTTTAAPTTSTVPLPPVTEDPQSYAQYLFAAWENGDRTAAAQVASADAVDQIFARQYSAQSQWVADGCGPAAGSLYCTWNGAGGAQLVMTVRTLTGGLPVQVTRVEFQNP